MLISSIFSLAWALGALGQANHPQAQTRILADEEEASLASAFINKSTVGDGSFFLGYLSSVLVDPNPDLLARFYYSHSLDVRQRQVNVQAFFDKPAAADALYLRYVDPLKTDPDQALAVAAAYTYLYDASSQGDWQYNGVDIRDRLLRYQQLARSWSAEAEDRYRTQDSPRGHTMLAFAAILRAKVEDDSNVRLDILDKALKLSPFDHESVASVLEIERMKALIDLRDPLGFIDSWDEHVANHPNLRSWWGFQNIFAYNLVQSLDKTQEKDFDDLLDGDHEESPR
jgi:hypothetical protein